MRKIPFSVGGVRENSSLQFLIFLNFIEFYKRCKIWNSLWEKGFRGIFF